jgi:putative ABC transport system substrate-binding protein
MALVFTSVLLLFLAGSTTAAEKKRVIVIQTMPVPACEAHLKWFMIHFEDMGYEDGRNVEFTVIKANGDRQIAEDGLRKELERGKPDAVVTIATLASQAAAQILRGTDIPVFFFQVSDPVGAGLVKELGRPTGTNITGRVFTVPRDIRLDMVSRLLGQIIKDRPIRFGFIHSSYPSAMGDLDGLKMLEQERTDIRFMPYQIEYRQVPAGLPEMLTEVETGIDSLSGQVDFWWEPQGPLGETESYSKLLLERSTIPIAMGQTMASVRMGALFFITPDLEAGGHEAAQVVDSFLKGAKPGDMPVIPPAKFEVGINLATAIKLNIVVPEDILEMAHGNTFR